VNYGTGSYSGYSWQNNAKIQALQCFLYIKPQFTSTPSNLKPNCNIPAQSTERNVIKKLQAAPLYTSVPTVCIALEGTAAVVGSWEPVQSSNAPVQELQYSDGTQVLQSAQDSKSSSYHDTFAVSVTAYSVTIGLNGGWGQGSSHGKSDTLRTTKTQVYTDNFPSGVVWQWVMLASGAYTDVAAQTRHLRLTSSLLQQPCCEPGYDPDISNPTNGNCLNGKNLCTHVGSINQMQALTSSVGLEVKSWMNIGDGICSSSSGTQPRYMECKAIHTLGECQALCDSNDFCEAVNFSPLPVIPGTGATGGCQNSPGCSE
jgi:hypothetical protein